MSERGSVLPLAVIGVVVAALSVFILVGVGTRAIEAADAQVAADMAALAGVFEGRSGAAELAERNGAELVSYDVVSDEVRVVVRLGSALAQAAAAYEIGPAIIVGDEVGR